MRVSNGVNNPTLGYRLDPGEPGLLRKAKASDSTRAVTSQELRNLNRLRSDAMLEGRTVIKSQIKYSQGIDGSFSTVRAGQTTVVSVAGPESLSDLSAQAAQNATPKVVSSAVEVPETQVAAPQEETAQGAQAQTGNNSEKQKLDKSERELQAQINKLKNQIAFNRNDEESTDDIISLRFEKSQAEQELRKVRFQKLMQQQDKVLNNSTGAVVQSNGPAFNITASAHGGNSSNARGGHSLGMHIDRSI